MSLSIFYTVNSGLYLVDNGYGLLVDGLHGDAEGLFSVTPDALAEQVIKWSGPFGHLKGMLFTHLHDDHYDERLVKRLMATPQPPLLYGPGLAASTVASTMQLRDGIHLLQLGGVRVLAMDTVHDGKPFQNEKHQSFLVDFAGEGVFIAGDAVFTGQDACRLKEAAGDVRIAAGFFNLFQLGRRPLLEFVRELAPKRVFLYHLPFPQDDTHNLAGLAARVIQRVPGDIKVECLKPLAWVEGFDDSSTT